jgi:hypothetical protein
MCFFTNTDVPVNPTTIRSRPWRSWPMGKMIQQTSRFVIIYWMSTSCLSQPTCHSLNISVLKSWSNGSWIYNYLCNRCISPLKVRILPMRDVLDTALCHKVSQWLAAGRRFSQGTPVSSPNNTDGHDIIEILLKVELFITLNRFTSQVES